MKTQNSVDGQRVASALNVELLEMADKGDPLHQELAHRVRVLTTNLTQCEAREHELVQNELYLAREIQDLGRQVAEKTVGSEDRRPNLSAYSVCNECGVAHSALVRCPVTAKCHECGGHHEPSGARSDCIAYWRQRAWKSEGVTAHANAGTQRPGTPDGSLATETRKPGSLK